MRRAENDMTRRRRTPRIPSVLVMLAALAAGLLGGPPLAGPAVAGPALAGPALAGPAEAGAGAGAGAAADPVRIPVDGAGPGRVFDGVGAISSSSSKLLYDYPEPQRSRILDALFLPHHGASLQVLKVEIGGDTNSTVTSEPSHERTRGAVDCDRGIEWWLMQEAHRRNPAIRFAGLMWGAPGWFEGGLWSHDQVGYTVDWLDCAARHGLDIGYVGGVNESYTPPPSAAFFKDLRRALATAHPETKIVATDEHVPPDYFAAATQMKADPDYAAAVDVLGEHDVCVWRSLYQHCHANQDALDSGKPLWNSEQSTQTAHDGAGPLARAMNRDYLDARITGNLNWALVGGFYGDTATGGTGLLLTEWPWSGRVTRSASVWVDAQTTQFTAPGWRYLDQASGYLPDGGSYVTLHDPATGDYTIVVETLDATATDTARFDVSGGLSDATLHQWSTDLTSDDDADWFVRGADVRPHDRAFTATFRPGRVYTLSTTRGQHKGELRTPPGVDADSRLPLPFRQDFEHLDRTRMAPYFLDQQGAFEAAPCRAGRPGTCYRQVITTPPLKWHAGGKQPTSVVGDPLWWGDYEVAADALLEQPGAVEVVGRIENYDAVSTSGYHFRIDDSGAWSVYTEDSTGKDTTLASGQDAAFGVDRWHRLALSFHGDAIVPSVDGRALGTIHDSTHSSGQAGIAVPSYQHAEFDDVTVTATAPQPRLVPRQEITATASSEHAGVYQHHRYLAAYAVDGVVENQWKSDFDPKAALPQSLTLDLHRTRTIEGLLYKPPFTAGGAPDAITGYTLSVSRDGTHFTDVASGVWPSTTATKTVRLPSPQDVRYVRLTAASSTSGSAAASEVGVLVPAPK
ncbi:discoidin domain-containing protein [Streptomyces odontomachi]|uniref:discoidin domain-containing protein n=1 Tax=Streptomyces odontomachi TaxID=2944940 RepID=UPI00272EAD10|nr:discoidin domain-containing protein [Streptomyces sp. ODS25]